MLHAFKLYTGPDNTSHVKEGTVAENIAPMSSRSISRKRRRTRPSTGTMTQSRNT